MEASVATPAQGTPAQGQAQPGAPGQGQSGGDATGAGKGSFNWGLFPSVPEDQRGALEPHLANVQSHVTRMEQQYAPYRDFMGAVGPDEIGTLMEFLGGWSNNPLETWMGLAQSMVNDGVLGGHITPEALQAFIQQEQQGAAAGSAETQPDDMPAWARQMQQKLDAYEQSEQQRTLAQQEAEQDALLDTAKTSIREQLTQSGIAPELISDEMIVASIIANNGDVAQSVAGLVSMRDQFLTAFTQGKQGSKPANGQVPNTPKERVPGGSRGRRGDPFDKARGGALQTLKQSMAGSAQE